MAAVMKTTMIAVFLVPLSLSAEGLAAERTEFPSSVSIIPTFAQAKPVVDGLDI
jgi:hypothetical protein